MDRKKMVRIACIVLAIILALGLVIPAITG